MLPWGALYRLLTSDRGQMPLQTEHKFLQSSQAVSVISIQYLNDNSDRWLILTSACVLCQAGAAQTVLDASVGILSPLTDASTFYETLSHDLYLYGANVFARCGFSGWVVVPPKWQIRANAVFSAAGVANRVDLSLAGVLIPRGTFGRP